MKSISVIYPAITENTENILVKRVPHILIHESYNTSILAISNSFHSIVKVTNENKIDIYQIISLPIQSIYLSTPMLKHHKT